MTKRFCYRLCSLIALGAALAGSANGQQRGSRLSYNFVDLGYAFTDFDTFGDGNGVSIDFTKSISPNLFLYAEGSWATIDLDTIIDSPDGDSFLGAFGVGGVYPIQNNIHLVGKLGWAFSSLDIGDVIDSVDENGVNFEVGARALLSPSIEVGAFIGFTDLGEIGDGEDIELTGVYHVRDNIGVGVSGVIADGGENLTAFLRWSF